LLENVRGERNARPRLRNPDLRAMAGGYVRAWGEAPDGIHWKLGTRRDGSPLLTLIGDRYVNDDSIVA